VLEAAWTSETLLPYRNTTWCHDSEELDLNIHRRENLKQYRENNILITDHNVDETLSITDRAYLLFEGKVLFQGVAEELAENPIVREKYLGRDFELRRKNL